MTPARHVSFGTGAIGQATFEALARRGESVRLVNRSGRAHVPDGVEVIGGDARDPAFTTAVTQGARVVYQTLNPPYAEWTAQFPSLQAGVLAAAEANDARLVSMENVYMYGRAAGRALTEDRDHQAHTTKRRLRGRMANDLLAAHDAGRVEVAIGRASDYFGPRGGAQSNLGDRVMPAALSGRTATVLGDPDQPHTYTYIPDIGEGLAVLGEHPDAPLDALEFPDRESSRIVVLEVRDGSDSEPQKVLSRVSGRGSEDGDRNVSSDRAGRTRARYQRRNSWQLGEQISP